MRTMPLRCVFALALMLCACGQKGPLVLPDTQHPRKKIAMPKPPSAPAPASPATDSAPPQ